MKNKTQYKNENGNSANLLLTAAVLFVVRSQNLRHCPRIKAVGQDAWQVIFVPILSVLVSHRLISILELRFRLARHRLMPSRNSLCQAV